MANKMRAGYFIELEINEGQMRLKMSDFGRAQPN